MGENFLPEDHLVPPSKSSPRTSPVTTPLPHMSLPIAGCVAASEPPPNVVTQLELVAVVAVSEELAATATHHRHLQRGSRSPPVAMSCRGHPKLIFSIFFSFLYFSSMFLLIDVLFNLFSMTMVVDFFHFYINMFLVSFLFTCMSFFLLAFYVLKKIWLISNSC